MTTRRGWPNLALVCVAAALTGNAGVSLAQDSLVSSMDVLRKELDLDKRQVIASNLILTKDQAAAFWPIYDEYQERLSGLHERLARVMRDYAAAYDAGTITDEQALALLEEAIAVDAAEVELRAITARRLTNVIPGIEAARYLQLENKIHAVVKFDLADRIPLVE